jgi:hypothetical protein
MANKYAEAWAGLINMIGSGLSFADDLMDGAKWFAGELAVKWAAWLGRGLANTIDFAGDVAAGTTDAVSWGINAMLGTPENASNYSGQEWFLDKSNKHVQEWFDQIEDATKSKWWKSFVWEKISDWVGLIGELASPGGPMAIAWKIGKWVGALGKWIKIAKDSFSVIKNSPKAMAELKAAMEWAAKIGKALDQAEVDTILAKYVPAMWKSLANKTIKWVTEWAEDLKKLILAYTPAEIIAKSPKMAALAKAWKFGGKVAVADVIREMTQPEIDEIKAELSSTEDPTETPVKDSNEVPDGDITLPTASDFNPSKARIQTIIDDIKNSKFNVDPTATTPDTISDKKKELEILKEKKAWDLNMATSVVDLMKWLGVDSKQEARKIIFEKMTGKTYTASAEDNVKLKALIEEAFNKWTLPEYFPSLKR